MPGQIIKCNVIFLAILYSIYDSITITGGQPAAAVEDRPFAENDWHQLLCGAQRDIKWKCFWNREDDDGTIHPVTVDTEVVRQGTLPADLDVYLNDATEGTYRCSCQVNAEQTVLMKVIVFYSEDQRFRNFPGNATVEEGKLLNLTVCYLKHLPESPNLSTVTLVEEATGNTTIANLDRTDYCAHFSLENSQPGTYHFEVTHVHYGTINSRSFHIGVVQPPIGPTDNEETQPPTGATSYGVTVARCVWRRRRKKSPEDGQELVIEDGRQPAQPTPPPPNPSPPVQGAPADEPVNAGDQEIDQQLPEADVDAGAIQDGVHLIHHTRDNSTSHEPLCRCSVASSEDVISVCHMPTEETAPREKTTSYPRPTQVEDNSGGAQLTVRGMRRLSMTSEAVPTLVRDGHPTEVHVREPLKPSMQEDGMMNSESGPDILDH